MTSASLLSQAHFPVLQSEAGVVTEELQRLTPLSHPEATPAAPSAPGPRTPPGEAGSDFRRRSGRRRGDCRRTRANARRCPPPGFESLASGFGSVAGRPLHPWEVGKVPSRGSLGGATHAPFLDTVPSTAAPRPSASPPMKRALRPAAPVLTCLVPWGWRGVPVSPPWLCPATESSRHPGHPERSAAVREACLGGGGA